MLTDQDESAIGDKWREGHTKARISAELGIPLDVVDAYIRLHRDACPPRPSGRPRRTDDDCRRAHELLASGIPASRVGRMFGVGERQARRLAARWRAKHDLG